MNDFWKGVIATLTFQWLFGRNSNGGCGCSGCFTAILIAIGIILCMLGIL